MGAEDDENSTMHPWIRKIFLKINNWERKKEEQTKPVTSASSSLRLRGCAQNDKRTNKHLKHRKIS